MRDFNHMTADQLGRIYRTRKEGPGYYAKLNQLTTAIANSAKKDPDRFSLLVQKRAPKGFLLLREVEDVLAQGMWGCSPCPPGILEIKRKAKRELKGRSLAFGARLARTAARLQKAFCTGKLSLYVTVDETRSDPRFTPLPDWAKVPILLPKALLGYVFVGGNNRVDRKMPATFAIRPSRKVVGDDRLFALLNSGSALLVVREDEFRRWYRAERGKRKWPSQRAQLNVRQGVGRPPKQQAELRLLIVGIALEGSWDGRRQPLTALHRLLVERGKEPPSLDTLGRRVDEVFAETGELALRQRHRVRRR